MLSALLPLALFAAPADACPSVATGTPNALTYDVARTAIVRQGTKTTFTVSINPSGPQQDFALVMPIPGLLSEGDIKVLDSGVFARLGGQTGVLTMDDAGCSYPTYGYVDPCPDPYESDMAAGSGGDGSGGSYDDGGEDYGSVEVEAEYLIGDYGIAILSATESDDLFRYLNDHGYHTAEATTPILQEYLDEGMMFMTAKVSEAATAADGNALPPLQIAYDSPMFGIPVKLAAASSPGQQDMLIYAITEPSAGRVGISNYPEMEVEDTCIWGDPNRGDDFADFYEDRFNAEWEAQGQGAWSVEWAGESWSCSPCSSVQASAEDLEQLGYTGGSEHFLTRLHVRYTPETAGQDLVLYESGMRDNVATTFANDNEWNRWCILPCDEDAREARLEQIAELEEEAEERMEAEAEECADGPPGGQAWNEWLESLQEAAANADSSDSRKGGCSVVGGAASSAAALALVGLAAVGRRRDD